VWLKQNSVSRHIGDFGAGKTYFAWSTASLGMSSRTKPQPPAATPGKSNASTSSSGFSRRHIWASLEDQQLVKLVVEHGDLRWSHIASLMPGRNHKQVGLLSTARLRCFCGVVRTGCSSANERDWTWLRG